MSVTSSQGTIVAEQIPDDKRREIEETIIRRVFLGAVPTEPFDPVGLDSHAFMVVDRIIHDYSGVALFLNGPAWGIALWGAAFGSNQSASNINFVVAESRPLAICMAALHFIENLLGKEKRE